MIAYRFRMTPEQIKALDDESFLDYAARAELIRELEMEAVRDGILKALENIKLE